MYTSSGAPPYHSPPLRCFEPAFTGSLDPLPTVQPCQNYVLVIMKKPKPAGAQTLCIGLGAGQRGVCFITLTVGFGNTFDFVFLLDGVRVGGVL